MNTLAIMSLESEDVLSRDKNEESSNNNSAGNAAAAITENAEKISVVMKGSDESDKSCKSSVARRSSTLPARGAGKKRRRIEKTNEKSLTALRSVLVRAEMSAVETARRKRAERVSNGEEEVAPIKQTTSSSSSTSTQFKKGETKQSRKAAAAALAPKGKSHKKKAVASSASSSSSSADRIPQLSQLQQLLPSKDHGTRQRSKPESSERTNYAEMHHGEEKKQRVQGAQTKNVWTKEEDALLLELRQSKENQKWKDFTLSFNQKNYRSRSQPALQIRYNAIFAKR
jgi:hypothetical protein